MPASDQRPEGLAHELITLRDGRRLSGYYDSVSNILWLDGPYQARLRLRNGDILRRMAIIDRDDKSTSTQISQTTTPSSAAQRALGIRQREQQLAELDRRRADLQESMRLLSTGLDSLEGIRVGLEQAIAGLPAGSNQAQTLALHQRRIDDQIAETRRRLASVQEQLTSVTRKRDQIVALLTRVRQNTSGSSATASETNAFDAPPLNDTMLDMRVRVLEEEVRALRADNLELRRLLETLLPRVPPTTTPPAPATAPSSTPTLPADPVPAPPPATDEDRDAVTDQVARR
jgi:chromosome segregation ATPase